jgi:Rhodopirellula transposase DDE domain
MMGGVLELTLFADNRQIHIYDEGSETDFGDLWTDQAVADYLAVVVNMIAATTTSTGLSVHAELDTGSYPTGIKVSDVQMAALRVTRHSFHRDWNYALAAPARPSNICTARREPPSTAAGASSCLPAIPGCPPWVTSGPTAVTRAT